MTQHYDADGNKIAKKRASVKGLRAKLQSQKRQKEVAEAKLQAMKDLMAQGWAPPRRGD